MSHSLFSCGIGVVLDMVAHQNIGVSDVIVSDILDSDLLPIIFHILHHVKIRNLSDPIEKFTDNPAWKAAVNWVSKAIRRMTRKKALERWETKICNAKVTPQAIWPITKSVPTRDGRRAPTSIHGTSGLKFLPSEETNAIAYCLEIQFTAHELCDENNKRRV
jgi:hypothetical protein